MGRRGAPQLHPPHQPPALPALPLHRWSPATPLTAAWLCWRWRPGSGFWLSPSQPLLQASPKEPTGQAGLRAALPARPHGPPPGVVLTQPSWPRVPKGSGARSCYSLGRRKSPQLGGLASCFLSPSSVLMATSYCQSDSAWWAHSSLPSKYVRLSWSTHTARQPGDGCTVVMWFPWKRS